MIWVDEALYEGWRQGFRVKRDLARERSRFQDIVVFESWSHGRVMMLDGVVQITEADEFAYQEMIVHVPLIEHGAARRVLIIGAGDGGVLRHVLQHRSVIKAVMVEIDEAVVRLAQLHLPAIGGSAWTDPRAKIIIADGIDFVARQPAGTFDVIIVDSTDPAGPGEPLFTETFFRACARALTPAGILVNQSGVPFLQGAELRETTRYRRAAFAQAGLYLVAAPTYIGGFMALGFASNSPLRPLDEPELTLRGTSAGIIGETKYWTAAMHRAAFALPPYISSQIED